MKIHVLGEATFEPALFLFPGGEPHAVIDPHRVAGERVWIECPFLDPVDFLYFLATVDAVQRCHPRRLGLYIPYFPGARQDHPVLGTPYTLGIFADMVNALRADAVVVVDPHSPAVASALYCCEEIAAAEILKGLDRKYNGLICPDSGARRRVKDVSEALGGLPILPGSKLRDGATGKLSGFHVQPPSVMGRYLVVDDICDGGGTFIGLADAFRATGSLADASILDLYVTHGIFSKGFRDLNQRYEHIITTDSRPTTELPPSNLIRLPLENYVQAIMKRRLA